MPQGISPNPLNKISEVYLSQISEHHKKDADGNTIPHEDELDEAKYEAGASTYGKASIRNKRRFGTKGENPDPLTGKKITKDATRGELITKRREEHKAKRGMKNEEIEVDEAMSSYDRNRKAAAKRAAERNRLRRAGKMGGRMENETYRTEGGVRMHHKGYKAEEVEVDEAMAMKPSNMKKKAKLSAALKRLEDLKVASKMKEEVEDTEE